MMQPFIPWRSIVVCGAVVALAGLISAVWARSKADSLGEKIAAQMEHRGKVVVVHELASLPKNIEGTQIVVLNDAPQIDKALRGSDASALPSAMVREDARTLFFAHDSPHKEPKGHSLWARFLRRELVPGMRGVYLSPTGDIFENDPIAEIDEASAQSLLVVARGILEGQPPPRYSSFPEILLRAQNVEILLTLRENSVMRLWRSARSTSLARGLVAAAIDARRRWEERRSFFGGPLSQRLARLDVRVELLVDDGTLADQSETFLHSAVTKKHGMAAEYKGQWRYLLPADAHAYSSLRRARDKLFTDLRIKDAPDHGRADIRLYRIHTRPLIAEPRDVMHSSL